MYEVWMCGFQGTRNRRRSAYCAESFQDGGFGYKVTKLKPRKRRTAQTLHRFPVTMAKGIHLFPYRTQKLSLSAPMVLGWRRPGRVGRCRIPWKKGLTPNGWVFLFILTRKSYFQIIPTNVQHCTWLGFFLPPAVRDASRKNHMEGQDIVVFWVFRNQNICLWKRIKIYAIMSITNRTRCNEEKRRCPLGSFVWTKTVAQRGARSIQKAKKCLVWYSVHRNLLRSMRQRLKPNISEKS